MSPTHPSSLKRLLFLFVLASGFKHNESQASAAPIGDISVFHAGTTAIYHTDDVRCYQGSISGSEVTCPVPLQPLSEHITITPIAVLDEHLLT
ncbi:hypothetical protein DFS33DRAFT_1387971 [Desarmillaria ectypa]|nr:hypothetical protein DFS33DRAFT_1387971 [Desarmillaria ectypa]